MSGENKQYNPLISIIIPCYNGGKYLAEALDSVANQTYINCECIVVDDGSIDNSKEITLLYIQKDNRFKYIYQVNAGPCVARNLGIKESKGEFIQFLDSDDMIEKEKLSRQLDILRDLPLCDIVYGDMRYFYRTPDGQVELEAEDNKFWKKGKVSGQGDVIIKALLHGNIMVVNSPLIRKTVFDKIGLWDEQIPFNEDWDLWTRCAINGISFQFDGTKDTRAMVRVHLESRSRDSFKMYLSGLMVCLKINRMLKLRKYKGIIMPKIYNHQRVLDKKMLEIYKVDRANSFVAAFNLYKETGLFHYRLFSWFIRSMPYNFCEIYSKGLAFLNRIKCKIIYES